METLHKAIQKAGPVIKNSVYEKIRRYYDIAGPDYSAWSSRFNMHFGYCRHFTDIFRLEKMLNNMNQVVLDELHLKNGTPAHIADLGCGVGTVARFTAKRQPLSKVTGITISEYQISKGKELILQEGLEEQVNLVVSNFEQLDFPDNHFSHAYALESACHARGDDKSFFIAELTRTLKPGGRFCVADGFIKHNNNLPRIFSRIYQKVLGYWALPSFARLPLFVKQLEANGLTNIKIREISMRIAPSVAWVPWTCIKFFVKELWKNKSLRMEKERWNNVYGPVMGMILGLYRKHFGYYIISGAKS
jgi:MPBQ/MSBQ methyltransferase